MEQGFSQRQHRNAEATQTDYELTSSHNLHRGTVSQAFKELAVSEGGGDGRLVNVIRCRRNFDAKLLRGLSQKTEELYHLGCTKMHDHITEGVI